MLGTVAFPRARKPGVEEGTQLGQGSRTMVQGQQDQVRSMLLYQSWRMEPHFPSCSDAD